MKTCTKCEKPGEFNKGQFWCRKCQKQYKAVHYKKNKKRYLAKSKNYRKRMVTLVENLKSGPCVDCDHSYPPWVMDWDHKPGSKKVDNVANLARDASEEKIRKEISKCELVCANCHRQRTHDRNTGS